LKYISSSYIIYSISSLSPLSFSFAKYFSKSSFETTEEPDFLDNVLEESWYYAFSLSLIYFSLLSRLLVWFSTQSLGGNWLRKFLYLKAEEIAYSFLTLRVRRELTVICLALIYCSFASLFCTCFSNCSSIFFVSALYFS